MNKNNRNIKNLDSKKIDSFLITSKKDHFIEIIRMFFNNKLAITGGFIIFIIILVAIFADFIAPYDPFLVDSSNSLAPPSKLHIFGTDQFGRDLFSRVIFGTRISMTVGIFSVLISAIIGTMVGAFAGFYGGIVETILMRIMDTIFSFPTILLAITLAAILGPNTLNVIIAIGIIYIPIFARVVRSTVLANKQKDYVEAAVSIGQKNFNILFFHILPNCISPIIVQATVAFAEAIIIEAGLSFVGLGPPPPSPSWGRMLSDARQYMTDYPLLAIFPGLAISITILGLNLLGDGLRDILDPRLKSSNIGLNYKI